MYPHPPHSPFVSRSRADQPLFRLIVIGLFAGVCLALGACLLTGCSAQQITRTRDIIAQTDTKLDDLVVKKAQLQMAAEAAFEIYKSTRNTTQQAQVKQDYLSLLAQITLIESEIAEIQKIASRANVNLERLLDPSMSDLNRGVEALGIGARAYRDAGLPYGEMVLGVTSVIGLIFGLRKSKQAHQINNQLETKQRQFSEVVTAVEKGKPNDQPESDTVNLADPKVRGSMSPDTQAAVRKEKNKLKLAA